MGRVELTPVGGPTAIEQRYRQWLRLLPASYRAARGDEMVAAFMDSRTVGAPEIADIDAEYGHPGLREIASLIRLALLLRWGGGMGAPARYRALAAGTRAFGLGVGLLLALVAVLGAEGRVWVLAHPLTAGSIDPFDLRAGTLAAIIQNAELLWVVVVGLALIDRVSLAQIVGLAIVAVETADAVRISVVAESWIRAVVGLLVVAAIGADARDAPALWRRSWLVPAVMGVAVVQVLLLSWVLTGPSRVWASVNDSSALTLLAVVIALTGIVRVGFRTLAERPAILLALASVFGAVSIVDAGALLDDTRIMPVGSALRPLVLGSATAELAVTAVVALLAAALSSLRLGRLTTGSGMVAGR